MKPFPAEHPFSPADIPLRYLHLQVATRLDQARVLLGNAYRLAWFNNWSRVTPLQVTVLIELDGELVPAVAGAEGEGSEGNPLSYNCELQYKPNSR